VDGRGGWGALKLVEACGLAATMMGVVTLGAAAVSASSTNTAVYTTKVTIPAPPSSNFSGATGGGDGWAIGLTKTQLFNVFHHQSFLGVNCHNQSDASQCWTGPKTITDTHGNGFATAAQPGLYVDQASGHLFVFATRSVDGTAGVVCIDTTKPATDTDPFCGFTPLSAVGQGPLSGGISHISDPVIVGTNWYAFNFVDAVGTGTENKLMCFNLTTLSACPKQPFAVNIGSAAVTSGSFPSPSIANIGGQIVIPVTTSSGSELACYNPTTAGACSGSWPVSIAFSYPSSDGAPFPLTDAAGNVTGLCLPTGTDQCYTLKGASVATPAGLTTSVTATSGWDGPAFVLGPRVYVPNGDSNAVDCFDYSTGASCTHFPKALSGLELLYSVNPDPYRPTCIWINSDDGPDQIQNFDAFTGGPCGRGPIRVLTSSIVVPTSVCAPISWDSLQILSPARSAYTSGSVAFQNVDGTAIPGLPTETLNATGSVDLSKLTALTQHGLPQYVITLVNPPVNLSEVEVQLTWTAQYSATCLTSGITAATTTTQAVTTTTAISGVTTPHTGEPWAGSAPIELGALATGLGLLGVGQLQRRRGRRAKRRGGQAPQGGS